MVLGLKVCIVVFFFYKSFINIWFDVLCMLLVFGLNDSFYSVIVLFVILLLK